MTRRKPRLQYPETRLTKLLARGQGRPRAEAVLAGTKRLEAQRAPAMAALEALIAGLERHPPARGLLTEISRDGDRIIALALTFGLLPLADAAKRLCDMTALFRERNSFEAEALGVHIRALRLFAPDSPILGDEEAMLVLGRIAALAAHFSHLSAK
jgi:hypothetical protein